MKLIKEHIENVRYLTEKTEDGKKNLYIEGIFLVGDAVNRNNRHTLELRFFRPSLRPDTVLACIEFTYCLWAYTEQVTSNQALKHGALTDFEQFAIYARKHRATYPKFVAHLAYRGVSPDPDQSSPTAEGEE